jgi:hypothetical protein
MAQGCDDAICVYLGSGESVLLSFVNLVRLTVPMNRFPAMCTDRGSDEMNRVCAPLVILEGVDWTWIRNSKEYKTSIQRTRQAITTVTTSTHQRAVSDCRRIAAHPNNNSSKQGHPPIGVISNGADLLGSQSPFAQ